MLARVHVSVCGDVNAHVEKERDRETHTHRETDRQTEKDKDGNPSNNHCKNFLNNI